MGDPNVSAGGRPPHSFLYRRLRHGPQAHRMSRVGTHCNRSRPNYTSSAGRCQSFALLAAVQREPVVNELCPMCSWLFALLLLPVCALALDISYGNGQQAECVRDRFASGMVQCSEPSHSGLMLNCLGDRIKTIQFFVKDCERGT